MSDNNKQIVLENYKEDLKKIKENLFPELLITDSKLVDVITEICHQRMLFCYSSEEEIAIKLEVDVIVVKKIIELLSEESSYNSKLIELLYEDNIERMDENQIFDKIQRIVAGKEDNKEIFKEFDYTKLMKNDFKIEFLNTFQRKNIDKNIKRIIVGINQEMNTSELKKVILKIREEYSDKFQEFQQFKSYIIQELGNGFIKIYKGEDLKEIGRFKRELFVFETLNFL